MNVFAAALILTLSFLQPRAPGATHTIAANRSIGVTGAFSLCRARPTAQQPLWIRGWFVPSIVADGYVEGGLFNARRAIPLTTVDQWDVNGNWKRYGALYVRIGTRASFGPRSLTLHGRLDCSSYRFQTDRDPFPPPQLKPVYGTALSGRTGAITTWAIAGGLKLTLTIPRRSYPRDALARVRVSIRNVAKHDVGYWTTGVNLPGVASPQAEVLDRSGRIVFPPAMPYMPPLPGPPPTLVPLKAGQTIGMNEYIVVRGAGVRASQRFVPHLSRTAMREANILTTHLVSIRLTAEAPPKLILRQSPEGPAVDVVRPPNVSGSPLLLTYTDCGVPVNLNYSYSWIPSGLHLTPGCSPVQAWHLRVAWLDHPVAAFDYTAPQPTSTTTPLPTPTATATATRTAVTPTTSSASFNTLLRRADHAMASIYTLHTAGSRTYSDPSAQTSLHIRADCRSQNGIGLPVTARTLVFGSQTQAGRIDEGYVIEGPALRVPGAAIRAWHRSLATSGRWRPIDIYRQWGLDSGLSDPVWFPDPAYLNQICPGLIRLTYLAKPIPAARHRVLGRQMLDGHQVWHLREQIWFKLDLFVDAGSFQLRRLVLWDGASQASIRWRIRFDYSRLNVPVRVTSPGGG